MKLRQWRLERGWSQEQLAELAGLSVRTIQRIENGHNAGLETWKSLAAVFDVSVKEFMPLPADEVQPSLSVEEIATRDARAKREFITHALTYVVFVGLAFGVNWMTNPDHLWSLWLVIGWGVALGCHGLHVVDENIFGLAWEKKQVKKQLEEI